ncbi:MAG: aspartyl protease family protein [Candidatus Aureabacteria bacterium]|nr:aspartyl protease family protein [Candidatus Auribacterota bacterium]
MNPDKKRIAVITSRLFVLIFLFIQIFLFAGENDKIRCKRCSYFNDTQSRFCAQCGAQINSDAAEDEKKPFPLSKEKVNQLVISSRTSYQKARMNRMNAQPFLEKALSDAGEALRSGKNFLPAKTIRDMENIRQKAKLELSHFTGSNGSSEQKINLIPAGDTMMVNVILNETLRAQMMLDTGCSLSLISPSISSKLGIKPVLQDYVILADGRKVRAHLAMLNSIELEGNKVRNIQVVIHDTHGDGLLGMSFLKHFNFKVDHDKKQLILEKG